MLGIILFIVVLCFSVLGFEDYLPPSPVVVEAQDLQTVLLESRLARQEAQVIQGRVNRFMIKKGIMVPENVERAFFEDSSTMDELEEALSCLPGQKLWEQENLYKRLWIMENAYDQAWV